MEWAESELLETLEELGERELQRFKDKLSEIQPKEGYQYLTSGSLRNADPLALADLLLLLYGTDDGAEVAVEVLRAIDQGALAERLKILIDALEYEKYYFEWQHHFARGGFVYVECALNDEQYQTIRAEKTRQEKMRKLYELVPGWDEWQKDRLYQALKETNRDLVEELEGGHFVDRHREKLIQRVPEVDRVLKLLRGHTLTPQQYQSISAGRSNVEKMQKLYELVPSWGREHKDRLYRVLWITNRALVDEFAGVGTRAQKPSTSTSPGATREHFVERHREQLIQRASSVDRTLDVLKRSHYMLEQKSLFLAQKAANESLTEEPEGGGSTTVPGQPPPLQDLCCLLHPKSQHQQWWERNGQWFSPASKRRTGRGGRLRNRPHILNDEQYQMIGAEKTSQEKMRKLYELVPSWGKWQKDRLYQVLKKTNRGLVEKLKGVGTRAQKPSTSTSPGATWEHFVERHREQLIRRTSSVDRILHMLHRHVRSDFLLRRSRQAPRFLPAQELKLTHDTWHQDQPYLALKATSESLTEEPEGFTSKETESDSSSAAAMKAAGGIICQQTLLPSIGSVAGAAGETSRRQSLTAFLRGQHKCNWCAREEEDLPEEIKPEIIPDLDGNQEMYRVHFPKAGWFCCPETELEFEVRAAVTIQYGYSSWRQHLTELQEKQWMVAGPLFDIRVEPTEAVAAIHLPHFLCLRDADNSRMQIARFIDEGMILENPKQVRSFHAVLENPSFSLIGLFWRRENSHQRTQVHSTVLLYQARKTVNLTLHLYLIPDDGSRVKAVEVYEEKCRSWFVSKSHFTPEPLCFGSCCIVSSLSAITVTPEELPFLDKPAEAFQPFTEIHTTGLKKELKLTLAEKNDRKQIWEAVIRPEDLMPSVSSTEMRTDKHFVDQHREQLIQGVISVDGILDKLHGSVVDEEQYQMVISGSTNPEKMRKLYKLVPSWNTDCKDKLYQALKDTDRYLVKKLEGK